LKNQPESSVIFCTTKIETQQVADELAMFGFSCIAIHGDLDQKDRDQALVRFANKSVSILVATDVAARGLDIENLDAVINYQISRDPEVHVHRIGRTGRAGSKGTAYSIIVEKEIHRIIKLEDMMKQSIKMEKLPDRNILEKKPNKPEMTTLQIDGGKKQKVRAGDILGALTAKKGTDDIQGNQIGKIQLFDNRSFVAVHRSIANDALNKIQNGNLGYHVLNLITEKSTGRNVFVNRGWINANANRENLPKVTNPPFDWTVLGRIYPINQELLSSTAEIEQFHQVYRLPVMDVGILTKLEEKLGRKIEPFLIRLDKNQDNSFEIDWQWISMLPEKHLAYAFQWFSLAFTLLVISVIASLKRKDNNNLA
ncbi:MAG: DbpA RNA binding domain-containing protein, partial [Alcanivoracaceae bacterium]|nr:DbpA RNA binding domain-containing protein [Alcanivoracaceae bacterium]